RVFGQVAANRTGSREQGDDLAWRETPAARRSSPESPQKTDKTTTPRAELSALFANSRFARTHYTPSAPRDDLNSIHVLWSGEPCRSKGYVEPPSSRFYRGTRFPTPNRTRKRLQRNAAIRGLSQDITSRYSTLASSRAGPRLPATSV